MEKKARQITNTVLMVEPVMFGYNEQTAANNYFQVKGDGDEAAIQAKALEEFTAMVKKLTEAGVRVITVKDTAEPRTPDSIFPNNWITFHANSALTIYPMYAPNRRAERRSDIFEVLISQGFSIQAVNDYTHFENENRFLEGTGSMILDHVNRLAYAAISERTEKNLFLTWCRQFKFNPVCFNANQWVDCKRLPVYHTNVMMCLGKNFAVVCIEAIDERCEQQLVAQKLIQSGKEIIEITEKQMHQFAGNMLQLENDKGEALLVLSGAAYKALLPEQIERLKTYNPLLVIDIPTIEKYGGGSVRCMMAEVFNPLTNKN